MLVNVPQQDPFHLFSNYRGKEEERKGLSTCHMPGTVLSMKDTTEKGIALGNAKFSGRGR